MARLWPAYLMRHGPFLAYLVFSNEKACSSPLLLRGYVPSNFLKPVCAQNFLCATFYKQSSIFRMPCLKYVQTHFLKENLCAPKFYSVRSSHDLCAREHAHSLEGTLLRGAPDYSVDTVSELTRRSATGNWE